MSTEALLIVVGVPLVPWHLALTKSASLLLGSPGSIDDIQASRSRRFGGLSAVGDVPLLRPAAEDKEVQVPRASTSAPSEVVMARGRPEDEVVYRLREILRIREQAYQVARTPELLHSIYSSDCPCLLSEERAIMELIDRGYIWDNIATSIDVRSVRKINSRLWIVVARFSSRCFELKQKAANLLDKNRQAQIYRVHPGEAARNSAMATWPSIHRGG